MTENTDSVKQVLDRFDTIEPAPVSDIGCFIVTWEDDDG